MFTECYEIAFLKALNQVKESKDQENIKSHFIAIFNSIKNICPFFLNSDEFKGILRDFKKSESSILLTNLILLMIENGHSESVLDVLKNIKNKIIKEKTITLSSSKLISEDDKKISSDTIQKIIIDNNIIDGKIVCNNFKKKDESALYVLEKMNQEVKSAKLINFLF